MELVAGDARVREYELRDIDALARNANDVRVWSNLRDRFPHPYSIHDARAWLDFLATQSPTTNFAIEVDGECAGGIGYTRRGDVERYSAEIGYWLGARFWGRGIATTVLRDFVPHIFATSDIERFDAIVFEWNTASFRVLEKAGFTREGRLRNAVFKQDRFVDAVLYSRLRGDAH